MRGLASGRDQRFRTLGGVAQGQSKRLIIAVSVVRVHPPLRPLASRNWRRGALNPVSGEAEISLGHDNALLPALPGRG